MLETEQDPAIAGILDFTKAVLKAAFVDGAMVENFPFLQYLPSWLAGWKREAKTASVRYSGMFESLFGDVKKRVVMILPFFALSSSDPVILNRPRVMSELALLLRWSLNKRPST